MDLIASFLSGLEGGIDRPVLDRTGLDGKFDFNLEWAPESNRLPPIGADADPATQGPPVIEAVKEQLGLKLEPAKGPVETIVIDHIERPSAN
jgi:bla regulator protein blaR1